MYLHVDYKTNINTEQQLLATVLKLLHVATVEQFHSNRVRSAARVAFSVAHPRNTAGFVRVARLTSATVPSENERTRFELNC